MKYETIMSVCCHCGHFNEAQSADSDCIWSNCRTRHGHSWQCMSASFLELTQI